MILAQILLGVYLLFLGAMWITFAIRDFKAERPFAFGIDMMGLMCVAFVFAKCYFSI
jgi:hypothetical protein